MNQLLREFIESGVFCPRAAKLHVLYVCTGNSCRSQIAEGWTRALFGRLIAPCSAGVEPHRLDPGAVAAMAESGVDISQNRPKPLGDLQLNSFDCIVTLSERARAGVALSGYSGKTVHREFAASPKKETARPLEYYRNARDELRQFVSDLCSELCLQ